MSPNPHSIVAESNGNCKARVCSVVNKTDYLIDDLKSSQVLVRMQDTIL